MADDSDMISPVAAEVLTVMAEEVCLPDDWDVSGTWLSTAQDLAQFIADYRGKIAFDDAVMLTAIGGMLMEMARREREASVEAGAFLRRGGSHD